MSVRMTKEMADNQLFYVGQKAFIRKGNELLLLIDPKCGLDLPGGRIQEGESNLIASFKREISEEIGLNISIGQPLTTWTWRLDKDQSPVLLIGYSCFYISGEIRLSSEHSEYLWLTKEASKQLLNKYRKDNPEICEAIDLYFRT